MENLQVTGVRYFRTNRGLAYTCTTNIEGVTIENDGDGGGTYIEPYSSEYSEYQLEELINDYEMSKKVNRWNSFAVNFEEYLDRVYDGELESYNDYAEALVSDIQSKFYQLLKEQNITLNKD